MLIVVSNKEAWKTSEPWTQTYLYSNADMICSLHCIHIFQLRKWHNFEKKYVQFNIKFTSNQHTYKCQFEWVQAICHWLVLTFQSRTLPRNAPHIMSQNHKKTMQYEQRCAICNICIDSCIPVSLKKRSLMCPEKAEFETDHHSCSEKNE